MTRTLLPSVRSDAEAWELVEANLGLVNSVVGRHRPMLDSTRRDDAIQDGRIGLFRAAQLWEPPRPFAAYACHQDD